MLRRNFKRNLVYKHVPPHSWFAPTTLTNFRHFIWEIKHFFPSAISIKAEHFDQKIIQKERVGLISSNRRTTGVEKKMSVFLNCAVALVSNGRISFNLGSP